MTAPDWFAKHEADDDRRFQEQHDMIAALPKKEEIAPLVHDALVQFFSTKGGLAKKVIIGTAVVIGSLTVIFGGLKTILVWIGFTYLR